MNCVFKSSIFKTSETSLSKQFFHIVCFITANISNLNLTRCPDTKNKQISFLNDHIQLATLSYTEFYVEFLAPLFTELWVAYHVKNLSIANLEALHDFKGN